MDFIKAVHRRRVYPLMYCYAELPGRLDVDILKHSAFGQFVPEILCAYDYRHNRLIGKGCGSDSPCFFPRGILAWFSAPFGVWT